MDMHSTVMCVAGARDFQLLQLPETALDLVLQQLDPCSRASTAATCRKLRKTVPSTISELAVTCSGIGGPAELDSFGLWLEQHSSSLGKLTHCSFDGGWSKPSLDQQTFELLPSSNLQHLKLRCLDVQLESTADFPGVLDSCTGLTALDVEECEQCTNHATMTAIAALPNLQRLRYMAPEDPGYEDAVDEFVFPCFEHPQNPTHLTISFVKPGYEFPGHLTQIKHLAALVNLQHLELQRLPIAGHPDGWPSQLASLTSLQVGYGDCFNMYVDLAQQFQHLSCLTKLQDLAIACAPDPTQKTLPGIQSLSQLTQLRLKATGYSRRPDLEFSTAYVHSWGCRTVLQRLELSKCAVQPEALAGLSQLRALRLHKMAALSAPLEGLLMAVSRLSQLTELAWHYHTSTMEGDVVPAVPAAAFTTLTTSTNLQTLEVDCHTRGNYHRDSPALLQFTDLFQDGVMCPKLRSINIGRRSLGTTFLSEAQLQLLASCCPVLQCLRFGLPRCAPPTALMPLVQMPTLRIVQVDAYSTVKAESTAAVAVAAQLTQLSKLQLYGVRVQAVTLLQLTVLTNIQVLQVTARGTDFDDEDPEMVGYPVWCGDKEHVPSPPDAWKQLLQSLLRHKSCRQAVLSRSSAAAEAHAELMLLQLAATLAGELGEAGKELWQKP